MYALLARHRKEQKELQGKITSKRKNATKKTRKGVNDECEGLERDLKERQQAEIQAMAPSTLEDETAQLKLDDEAAAENEDVEEVNVQVKGSNHQQRQDDGTDLTQPAQQAQGRKPNRQKERLARRAGEQQAQMDAAAVEAANMPDQRKQELSAMRTQMEKLGLTETLIRPDGHCLYSACALTIAKDNARDYKDIRTAAASFMSAHPDDFAPFMEEPIESYTHKIKDTAEWGGHLELQAIAKAFSVNINVLQADGHVEKVTPNVPSDTDAWLAYYKHSFGLGEHYNALKKAAAG